MGMTFGTLTSMGSASNLNSLSNAQAKPLGAIDLTAGHHDCAIEIAVTTASSGVDTVGGRCEVYLLASQDGTDYTDNIDPAGTADISASIKHAALLGVIRANANSTQFRANFNAGSAFGALAKYHCVVVRNVTGAALQASGNVARYQSKDYS